MPDDDFGPIHRGFVRPYLAGMGYDRPRLVGSNRVLMFADEERPYLNSIDAIETLASVPEDAPLPDSFTKDNPKYVDFKKKHFKGGVYANVNVWDDQFRRTRVYIGDPRSLFKASQQSEDYQRLLADGYPKAAERELSASMAWETLLQDPHNWMHTVSLTRGDAQFGLPNFDSYRHSLESRYERAKANQINARRIVLRSQALNDSILEYNPRVLRPDGSAYYESKQMPMVELAKSIDAKIVYDSGFPGMDVPILASGQRAKERLVASLAIDYDLPSATDGFIAERKSIDSPSIQLAGIAAGLADEMYKSDRMRSSLPLLFEAVFINGHRMAR